MVPYLHKKEQGRTESMLDSEVSEVEPAVSAKEVAKTPPTGNDLLEAVALALEARGSQKTYGYEGIEYRDTKFVITAPVSDTVFGWISEELHDLGVTATMNTVGETLAALGIHGGPTGISVGKGHTFISDDQARHSAAHKIGCHCLGAEITGEQAAKRVRFFKK